MFKIFLSWMGFIFLNSEISQASIKTETVIYKDGDVILEGYLATPLKIKSKTAPGVLVVHEWTGINSNIKKKTEALAELGYIAFASDIYGKGIRPTDPKEASLEAAKYKSDRTLLRSRALAGLKKLKEQSKVDPNRIAAIGYCFGGTTVLEIVRSKVNINGVVSFHGGLDTPNPLDSNNSRTKVLVLHGAEDPFVPEKDVKAFEEEMKTSRIDYQLIKYSGAVHSFTNPAAGNDKTLGAAYDPVADRRSWKAMILFFNELFGV